MSDKTITKTGHHDIAEILLKVALKHQKSINLMRAVERTNNLNVILLINV